MHQVVCVKRVPDTAAKVRVGDDGKSIDQANLQYDISPYDEMALAAAVELKEKHGGEITVVTLGPKDAQKEMRKCLAMGADKGVILVDDTFFRDPSSTAPMLAAYLKTLTFDLLLFGNKAVDSDGGQVGIRVAQKLGLPAVSFVTELSVDGQTLTAKRDVDGGSQTVGVDLPCVVTAQKGLAEPKHPSLKGIMAAKKKPLEEVAPEAADACIEMVSMEPPAERPPGKIVGEGTDAVPELIRVLKEEAKVL